jgi:L-alanine-DL-glutamate epimerase-like enolase superfamily enzyme
VQASVLGRRLDGPEDVRRINAEVRARSFDLLQADHTLSGLDIALWDLLGQRLGEPTYRLLGYPRALPRTAYASQLFGDDPAETHSRARTVARAGFRAAKFGWGPFGRGTAAMDAEHVRAAREGLGGNETTLLIDAGTVWGNDVERAAECLPALRECGVTWLEEPFASGALVAYQRLARLSQPLRLAGGEGAHNFHQAANLINYGGVGFIQIDTGRIGGITTAREIAGYAHRRGVAFVNHTFTTSLALSASLQPYAGMEGHDLCEFPFEPSDLAREFTTTAIVPDREGRIRLPDLPGLGVAPNWAALRRYLVEVEIRVNRRALYSTPSIPASTQTTASHDGPDNQRQSPE